jgi:hypothetical protein
MAYEAHVPTDLPTYPQIEFEAPGGLGEVALQVVVEPIGAPAWVGSFRSLGFTRLTELFTWSDAWMLLVVAMGYPHYVRAEEPMMRTEVPVFPVRHAIRHSSGLVVLGGFDRMCGLSGSSIAWVSDRVASDWIEDVQLDGDTVRGRGNIPSTGESVPFAINVEDGATSTSWREDV